MPGEGKYGTGHPFGTSFVKRFEDLPLNCSVALQEPSILLAVRPQEHFIHDSHTAYLALYPPAR